MTAVLALGIAVLIGGPAVWGMLATISDNLRRWRGDK